MKTEFHKSLLHVLIFLNFTIFWMILKKGNLLGLGNEQLMRRLWHQTTESSCTSPSCTRDLSISPSIYPLLWLLASPCGQGDRQVITRSHLPCLFSLQVTSIGIYCSNRRPYPPPPHCVSCSQPIPSLVHSEPHRIPAVWAGIHHANCSQRYWTALGPRDYFVSLPFFKGHICYQILNGSANAGLLGILFVRC